MKLSVPGIAVPAGPLAAAALDIFLQVRGVDAPTAHTAAVTLWCAVWWILQAVPMGATSLVPFAALPLLGVLSAKQLASSYGNPVVLLMLGGSLLSASMERTGAHRRLAIGMVRLVGGEGPRLVLSFLLTSALLSMWLNNTATALMLTPVALAVVAGGAESLAAPLLLAVAYGASVGGCGTPIGTPPNLIVIARYEEATGADITFLGWMRLTMPVVGVMLLIIWLWLSRRLPRGLPVKLPAAEPWRPSERRILTLFACAALAWATRTDPWGGWSRVLLELGWGDEKSLVDDSTVALLASLIAFALPSGDGDGRRLLDWDTARNIPWDVLLMFGAGQAIGTAFESTHLSELLGGALAPLGGWRPWASALVLAGICTFATEITSNTAVMNIAAPILLGAAEQAAVDPLRLMLPALLGINFAFMLPMATGPNAVVYGSQKLPLQRMIREGLALNFIGPLIVALLV